MAIDDVDIGYAASLAPEQAVEYFRRKGMALTWNWRDMDQRAHAVAFTVAKSAGFDVLGDVRLAMHDALSEGGTLRDFARRLEPTLREKGWWGRKLDPATGQVVQLGSYRRLETIYRTNLRTAMAAGRWKEQKANVAHRPYWMYDAKEDGKTRPSHLAMDNVVYRHDDPIWAAIYPPNGWGCRCKVRALTSRDVERMGLEVQSSKGRRMRVDQDFGVVQTRTVGVRAPNGETLIPDPGWGRRPLPDQAADQKLLNSIRRTWNLPVSAAADGGREAVLDALARGVQLQSSRALRELVEEARGAGVAATNVRPATNSPADREAAERISQLARRLPRQWVERSNLAPGVTVRARHIMPNGYTGTYHPRTKEIALRRDRLEDDSLLLHEYVHFVQEMNPDVDGLLWAYQRSPRGKTQYTFRPYATTNYADWEGGSVGGVLETVGIRAGKDLAGAPLELMTTTLQMLLSPDGEIGWSAKRRDRAKTMLRNDRDLAEFVIGLLLGFGGP